MMEGAEVESFRTIPQFGKLHTFKPCSPRMATPTPQSTMTVRTCPWKIDFLHRYACWHPISGNVLCSLFVWATKKVDQLEASQVTNQLGNQAQINLRVPASRDVGLHACTHARVHARPHTHTHPNTDTERESIYIYMFIYIYMCVYRCIYIYIRIYV